jgi:hypothetical protein
MPVRARRQSNGGSRAQPGSTEYLDGDLLFPVYGGHTTAEAMLCVDADRHAFRTRQYDHTDHEDVMFHFNTISRTTYFEEPLLPHGHDHCYVCAAEVMVLTNYLRALKVAEEDLPERIEHMAGEIRSVALRQKARPSKAKS